MAKVIFDTDNVRDTSWDHDAFENLVLDPITKNTLLALGMCTFRTGTKFDDFLKGKGT